MENVRIFEQKKQNILHLGVYCLELTIKADIRNPAGDGLTWLKVWYVLDRKKNFGSS